MIVGLGVDLVDNARIARLLAERPRAIERLLTARERAELPEALYRRVEYVAGRFASKEALAKALGTGIGGRFAFGDVSIIIGKNGAPEVVVEIDRSGRLRDLVIHLSISHERTQTVAVAVLEAGLP
ncbi:MAG: holo-ACP synthase [Hydrogenibacillus sp.]|nr:holo-ACP synthase [Hydrogenibacillus sp.]